VASLGVGERPAGIPGFRDTPPSTASARLDPGYLLFQEKQGIFVAKRRIRSQDIGARRKH
jgi:hypothetical protein